MNALEIGAKVRILDTEIARNSGIVGEIGVIEGDNGYPHHPFSVRWGEEGSQWSWFHGDEIELINDEQEAVNERKQETIKYPTYKVIYNDPATIVILETGEKGITKCLPPDIYDKEKGHQIALLKAQMKAKEKQARKLAKAYDKSINELEVMYLQLEELIR